MINLDPYITEFVSGNWIALSLFLGTLKVIARMTSWVGDDAIYTLLSGVFNQIRGKPPVGVRPLKDRGEELTEDSDK